MWPLDQADDVVRVGAHALELWRGHAGARQRVARIEMPHRCSMYDTGGLREALESTASLVRRGRAVLVFESAFMPIVLADTGGALWKPSQVDALLRHRFRLAYGGPDTNVDSWQVRTDFRFGERFALGYGMAPAVAEVLAEASLAGNPIWRARLPAFAWGLAQLKPWRSWPTRTGWFGWPEQDRLLFARVERGRITALNPAAPLSLAMPAIESLVDSEAQRHGGYSGERACIARWDVAESLPAPSGQVTWAPIGGAGRSPAATPLATSLAAPIA